MSLISGHKLFVNGLIRFTFVSLIMYSVVYGGPCNPSYWEGTICEHLVSREPIINSLQWTRPTAEINVIVVLVKILIILGPFLTIEYFCLITEINTAPAGSSFQGHYEKGL